MSNKSKVYSSNILQAKDSKAKGIISLLPLNLVEYNGEMKDLFYLDEVYCFKDNRGKSVFLGLVKEGSPNIDMRSNKRVTRISNVKDSNNNVYLLCNDGGLNTYAIASIDNVIYKFANYIKIRLSHKSAYYLSTHKVGVIISKDYDLGYEVPLLLSQPPNSMTSGEFTHTLTQESGFKEGDIITLYPYTQNDENMENGEYISRKEFAPISFKLDTPISFYNLIKISSPTQDLSQGTTFTTIIKEEDYTKELGLNELFATSGGSDNDLRTNVFPTGIEGVDNIQDTTFTTQLPEGYYYGVPKEWQGDDKVVIYIGDAGYVRRWYKYETTPTTYRVTTSVIYNASEPNTFSGRININAILTEQTTIGVVLQTSFGGEWRNVNNSEKIINFTSVGNIDITHTLESSIIWGKARWKVITTNPATLDIVENEFINPIPM